MMCGLRRAYQDGVHELRPYGTLQHISRTTTRVIQLTLGIDWPMRQTVNAAIRSYMQKHSQPLAQLFPAPDCPAM